MRQVTCTVFFWRAWGHFFGFYWFASRGMWALSIRIGPVGVELNNNAVWMLTERVGAKGAGSGAVRA